MTKISSYKDLTVWQKAIEITDRVYTVTESFPKEEIYGLASQMRRAAVSIPSNIAEGSVRGRKEYMHFLNISRGSLAELETQMLIAKRRSFISQDVYTDLERAAEEISRMLMGLIKSLGTTH